MQITVKFKINLTKEQVQLVEAISKEYIYTVNSIVSSILQSEERIKLSSKNVLANMPSAVKNQAIRDAKSICAKYKKAVKTNSKLSTNKQKAISVPTLRKPVCIWNNQNYSFKDGILSFPVVVEGKSRRIQTKTIMTDYQLKQLEGHLGALRITKKGTKYMAQISVEKQSPVAKGDVVMGVDLGLKVPAVAVTELGKIKFFGNGRENKYIKRKYRTKRKKLGKAKKLKAIKNLDDKEQRWMKDKDHKISRQIINFAVKNNVSVIRLEKLTNIRNTARTSRKNEKNLHTWSFYRLSQFIEYKAHLEGIVVEYVDPKYTSQICPNCGTQNKAKDRKYNCFCGYHTHRDRVGAINIMNAPVIDGNSLSA
ncbi:RNA-guided endonuclease InsQ/TnpB family protein [Alkaliphilus hydrothermalis]|uniref:IS605 OrfB family transposase n=1 Tax=Alkaliphilus hydrothermalis TaxID=1482730 RepID=A0ABS2NU39_9FIRM|nr:RNA-guided endonuclease TnpB family protein [Alkaliphilus hydrothermalis]MBM7616462.1 IS605 OrfB family transposase [Alkaliphilus hydrothermalis]